MRIQKRQFRIGELAKHLGVERFVVRFWEKEFNLTPVRSDGGQRFYEEKDLNTMQLIKTLLYDKGFTISGAKKVLKDKNRDSIIGSTKTTLETQPPATKQSWPQLREKLESLRAQLVQLQKQL
jgi:DNA-binding transcriptional MerR regulator